MKSRFFILLMLCSISWQAFAIDKQQLTDTLNAFVKERAYTESV